MVIQMTLKQFMELYNSPNIYHTKWVEATQKKYLNLKTSTERTKNHIVKSILTHLP